MGHFWSSYRESVFFAGVLAGTTYPSIAIYEREKNGYYGTSDTGKFVDSNHILMDATFQTKYGGYFEPVFIVEWNWNSIVTLLHKESTRGGILSI